MSDAPTAPKEPAIWVVVGVLLLALGVAEWAVPTGGGADVPVPEPSDSGHTVRNLYGLTPVDVAFVADALATQTDGDDAPRYVVAGYPGPERLNGPLLSRSTASRQMARERAEQLEGRTIGSGWRQLTVVGRDKRHRRPLLSGASVYVESDGNRRVCPRVQLERFACAPPGWSHVRAKTVQVGGSDASCIWSHPLEDKRIVVDFGPVDPRSKGEPYEVRTALDDGVAGEPGGVDVDIRVGERQIDHRHRAQKGWQTAPPLKLDGAEAFSVAISADRVGRRHFCFEVE